MQLFQVDAFADEVFGGNPAAVCLLAGPAGAAWMQSVASEMNLSETAFVEPRGAGYGLRWFTPVAEVGLCGHATLASAHVLYEAGLVSPAEPVRFDSVSGPLIARREDGLLVLDFPAAGPSRPRPRPGCCPPSVSARWSGPARAKTTSWWSCPRRMTSPGCGQTRWHWPAWRPGG